MRFGYTIIYVEDVEATVAFYATAFNIPCAFLHDSKQYAELATGEVKLAFASEALGASNGIDFTRNRKAQPAPGFEIAFISEDIHPAYHQAIAAGAVGIAAPKEKPWGQTVAYLRDLNGILIEICTPIG